AYKAAIKGVFARGKEKLPYTIQDAYVKSESIYSKAILSLLRMEGGGFTRKEVYTFMQNPCFLTKTGLQPEDVS
ncbi:MAG: hypothetical protein AAF518_26905, partial [Spirochaetota bacterium]